MIPPTAASTLSPALSIMQSIVSSQERAQQDYSSANGHTPNVAVTPAYSAQTTQKLNDFYFGDHQRASEVQAQLFGYLSQYMEKQIDAVENPGTTAEGTPRASSELTDSLAAMDADVRASLKNTLSGYSEGRQSMQATATKMLMTMNLDVLAKDRTITRYLEQMIGFDLKGMTAKDILQAFADPTGAENDKLDRIISDALAGEEGSKVRQRLDDAVKGLRSVAETRYDIEDIKPYDEVDDETKEEDKNDLELAKAFDTLNETRDYIEDVHAEEAELTEAKVAIELAALTTGTDDADSKPDAAEDATAGAGEADDSPDEKAQGAGTLYQDDEDWLTAGPSNLTLYL